MTFFLGGHDLEMVTIRDLLTSQRVPFFDRNLPWGCSISAYRKEINALIGQRLVFVELIDDCPRWDHTDWILVDHHGSLAHKPSSLRQVFELLQRPISEWTRWYELVDANDRGHVALMLEYGASQEELIEVRRRDRESQGIDREQEFSGRLAAENATRFDECYLTIVDLPHDRTATVTDALCEELGGPGYERLLILSPRSTHFYGDGKSIERLTGRFPNSWSGGTLPKSGYWGTRQRLPETVWKEILLAP